MSTKNSKFQFIHSQIANRKLQIAVLLLLPFLSGCNLIGALAAKAIGQDVEAKYLPTTRPMVVIAENWRNPVGSAVDVEQLTRYLFDELRTHKVGYQIDPMPILDFKTQTPEQFHALSVAALGRRVGASQVLYINVTGTTVDGPEASDSLRGHLTARIKVIDTQNAAVLWPTDLADGFPVTVVTPMTDSHSSTEDSELRRSLQHTAAVQIAKLFYKSSDDD